MSISVADMRYSSVGGKITLNKINFFQEFLMCHFAITCGHVCDSVVHLPKIGPAVHVFFLPK